MNEAIVMLALVAAQRGVELDVADYKEREAMLWSGKTPVLNWDSSDLLKALNTLSAAKKDGQIENRTVRAVERALKDFLTTKALTQYERRRILNSINAASSQEHRAALLTEILGKKWKSLRELESALQVDLQ